MANPLDLFDPERRFGDTLKGGSDEPAIPTTKQAAVNRFKASDMADRGIPSYQNEHGDVTELRDAQGGPLNSFDATHNIAYDAKGDAQEIVPQRTGPPMVRSAFANIPPVTDPKTGAIEQYGAGGTYRYVGQDPELTASAVQTETDKATKKEAGLLGRKLKLDEHDLISGTKEHKALVTDLRKQVPTLLDPKYDNADAKTILKGVDDHFNAEYASPEANATSGFFGKTLTPEAQALRADIDKRKAEARNLVDSVSQSSGRLDELKDSVVTGKGQQRDAVETLLAHARGEKGPLDVEKDMVAASNQAVPQLYPPEKDWSRMLGGAKEGEKLGAKHATTQNQPDQTDPNVPTVTGQIDTDEAIKQAKAGNKTYGVGDDDMVHFKPETLYSGLYHATRDGLIDPKWADEHRAEFKAAQDKYNELVDAAGNAQVLKAIVHGAGIGGAFLAGAAPGAKAGALAGAAIPGLGETGISEAIGGAIGGLATGTIAAFYAKKGIDKLAEYSDAVKSLTASAELHPVASAGGELLAFGASAPRALTNLYRLSTVAGKAVEDLGPAAMRAAQLKVVGRQLGIGVVSGTAFTGLRAVFDATRYAAADAFGIPHDQFQSPDAKELLTNSALAILTAAHHLQFKDYSAGDVASIMFRAKIRNDAGIKLDADVGPQVVKAATDAGIKFDVKQSAAVSKPLTPQEISVWTALRDKTERMQRSGAFDDATGVKFTGATQAQVPVLGKKEGAPIVSAGVEPVKGEKPVTKPVEALTDKKPSTEPPPEPEGGAPAPTSPKSPAGGGASNGAVTAPKSVDEAAHQAATSPKNGLIEPTPAQKEAGNYTKGHQVVAGLDISFENPAGSRRKPEFKPLGSHYGYIKGTVGADKDHVDVFVKPGTATDYAGPIFVVNQHNRDGNFDEHKAIIGVDTPEAAKAEYLKNYQPGWSGGKEVVEFPNPQAFKNWVMSGKKGQPAKHSEIVGPVLLDAAGKVIAKGKIGQTHKDLADAIIKNPDTSPELLDAAVEAGANDKLHAFIDKKGNVIQDRKQAGRIAVAADQAPVGTGALQSQHLIKHAAAKAKVAAAEEKKVTDIVNGAMAAHRDTLTNLGHDVKVTVGKVHGAAGIGTLKSLFDDKAPAQITIDPKKLAEATKGFDDRAKVKFIQRAVEEEILHVAALKWEGQAPENKDLMTSWGNEADELAAHLAKAYDGWEGLNAREKGHEKLRAVLQKRWTGKLTEAAYRALRAFLKYLRGIYDKLTVGQKKIVDDVEAILKGETKPAAEKPKPPKPDELSLTMNLGRFEKMLPEMGLSSDLVDKIQKGDRAPGLHALGEFHETGTLPEKASDLAQIAEAYGWKKSGNKAELEARLMHNREEMFALEKADVTQLEKQKAQSLIDRLDALNTASSYGNRNINAQRLVVWANDSIRKYKLAVAKAIQSEAILNAVTEGRPISIKAATEHEIRAGLEQRGYKENVTSGLYEFQGKPRMVEFRGEQIAEPVLLRQQRQADERVLSGEKGVASWQERFDVYTEQKLNPPTDPKVYVGNPEKVAGYLAEAKDKLVGLKEFAQEIRDALATLPKQEPIIGGANATTSGEQQSSQGGELPRVPPRTDLRPDQGEIRQGNGEQATGSGGAVERTPTPVEEPQIRQPATTSKLDAATQKQLKDAFKGLFAGRPEIAPLSDMEKTALTALRTAKASGKLGAAGEKQLRRLEDRIQSQGDLGLGEAFSLTGETAIDGEALQAQLDAQEKQALENKRVQDESQGALFAAKPTNQLALPIDKLVPFVQLAQKLLEQGIDTPEKLANELQAADERTIPYSQAIWDLIGSVQPTLRGTHDWTKFYPKQEKSRAGRLTRKAAPDGGFSEHPFIQAIMGDLGGLLSKTAARNKKGEEWWARNKELYDDAPALADPRHSKIYNPKSGVVPDEAAAELADMGLLHGDGDVSAMWREIQKISESSKRIERQEREQARLENDYQEPDIVDPFADETETPLPDGTVIFTDSELGYEVLVAPREDGQFAVSIFDESGNQLPTLEIFKDKNLAIQRAKLLVSPWNDTSSGIDLEPDRTDTTPGEQGGADSLPIGPGATGNNEPVSGDAAGGSGDPSTSGPLSSDVPSAPHREQSDSLFPESASEPAQRPAGSVEPAGGSQPSDLGLPPDTGRTVFPGENFVVPTDAQDVGSVGQSGGSELAAIQRAAPALTPEQADDVRFIEARLHEQGKPGVLLTNGTGTGKTFSGMGAVKMMLERGAKHILVAAPSDKIGSDWVHTAKTFFGVHDIAQLPDTSGNGSGNRVVVTTYANFGQNDSLVNRPWDLIVQDEAHHLSQNEEGDDTLALNALRALTFHPEGNLRRVRMLEPEATQGLQTIRAIERHNGGKLDEANVAKREQYQKMLDDRMELVRAEQSAKPESQRPKTLFLSATPWAYRKNVAYASGYLFDYPSVEQRGYNTPSPFGQFMIENFGYRMRTGRLTEPENAVATGILERRFAERLMREKAMRGRALVVPFDYSRDFVLTESQLGRKIDEIITKMMSDERLRHLEKYIGVSDYLQRRFILESLKAKEAIDRIRKHMTFGRKAVVFHDYKLGGALNPLSAHFYPGQSVQSQKHGTLELGNLYSELKSHFPDWEETSTALQNLKSPIQYFTQAFGADELGIFNGSVPKKQRRALVAAFNQKGGKMKVFLAQRASAKEGISLHDLFGDEQRAFIDLGIPGRPTDSIQSEGRIYRHGVQSNAIDEYLVTGTNFERWTFAQTIAQRASTAENLAMGEGARSLLQSFSSGFNEASAFEPHDGQGVGGKEADAVRERGNPYQNAVALYYTNEKKTSRSKSREGIDYYATPEPIGFKMVEWAALQPGEKFLEPSAGHGAIARFAPDSTTRHAVEPSNELAGRLALNAPDTEIHNQDFESFNIVNKFDGVAMNPPFGTAGKLAMEHLVKAAKHLRDGGRLVALIPRGKMDERLTEWLDSDEGSHFHLRAEVKLPGVTFERAGTGVIGRVVVIDRSETETGLSGRHHDLSDITDIKELFDRLEHLSVPARPEKKIVEPGPTGVQIEAAKQGPPQSGGYVVDPNAERKPLSPEEKSLTEGQLEKLRQDRIKQFDVDTLPRPTRDSSFTPADFIHTKENRPVYVAKTARRMSQTEFSAARNRAKQLGGYYSSFKGTGAIPGFHFKTVEARDAFIGGDRGLGAARPIRAVAAVYKDDVERVAKEIGLTAKEAFILLRKLVSPTTGVAMQAHDQVMKMLATRNQKAYETDRVLEEARKMFDDLDRPEQVAFIDRMKLGQPQPTPELQQVADAMRKIDTESWQEAVNAYSALGFKASDIPLAWLDNHYRVLWKKIPGQTAAQQSAWIGRSRRGLRGSMGQHKQHTLDDMSEGLDLGGVPYSYNPVVMFKLAQADLWKLTSTLRAWKWAKENGYVKFERGAHPKAPDGMVPLDDAIAKIYFPAASGEGLVAAGQYYVEEGFGRLLNNYLSRDVIRQVKLGRGLLWIKNATTSLELSLSLFHGVFETMETIGSNIGLGLNKLVNRGILKGDMHAAVAGIKDMVGALGTPVTVNNLGSEIRKAAADPTAYFQTKAGQDMLKNYPRAREMIDDLFAGGWKPNELEQDWKNNSIRTFIDALSDLKAGSSDNYVGAGLRAFPAANEFLMKPLFDYYIPNLKVGQFFKEYAEALEQNADKLANGTITRPALARQVWRFVEDRFGEMNFDSLFWNANFKTAMQILFRSVTWKLGSVEAFAGAFGGQAKEFKDAFNERRAPELHRNTSWLFGMLLLTASLGYVMSKTLAGKDPKDLKDYVFPQIDPKDDKIRVSLPTYFKDAVHLWHSPFNYITASMSGWIGRVMDLMRNKDYYGVQIRDTDDAVTKQALQVGKYVGETILPFSIRGYKNLSQQDVSAMRKFLAVVGVNPAPRYIGQSEAERRSEAYWKGTQTEAGVKPEQFETKAAKRKIVAQLRHGEQPNISEALASGSIKAKDIKPLYQRAHMGALASQVLHMPLDEAERVYSLATAREKTELTAIMIKKRTNAAKAGKNLFKGF